MGILSGRAIHQAILTKRIRVAPFDEKMLNPVSLDLRIGSQVRMYENNDRTPRSLLDCRSEASLSSSVTEINSDGFVLFPGRLYLMHTVEQIWTDQYVPIIDGKSSIGRLGIQVHMTAGFGDPGFDGQYTLEVTTVYPVRVYAGMRFCQMRFHTIDKGGAGLDLYKGNYTGQASMGPVGSKVWRQFE